MNYNKIDGVIGGVQTKRLAFVWHRLLYQKEYYFIWGKRFNVSCFYLSQYVAWPNFHQVRWYLQNCRNLVLHWRAWADLLHVGLPSGICALGCRLAPKLAVSRRLNWLLRVPPKGALNNNHISKDSHAASWTSCVLCRVKWPEKNQLLHAVTCGQVVCG